VLEVSSDDVLYSKLIENEGKGYVARAVAVGVVGMGVLVLPVIRDDFAELDVG